MFEECPKCGNLMTTITEMETGICSSCGWDIDDDPDDEDTEEDDYFDITPEEAEEQGIIKGIEIYNNQLNQRGEK